MATSKRPSWWRNKYAQQAVDFLQSLTLVGDYSGEPWHLDPFHESIVRELYGKRTPEGKRQTTKVSLWLPRGSAKTLLCAGICCYQLVCGPEGQEIYAASADAAKASRLFEALAQMLRANPEYSSLVDISDHYRRVKVKGSSTKLQVLAASEGQGNSLAPSTLILDEVHLFKHRAREYYAALTSGFQKRKPGSTLEIQISTAGSDQQSLAYELYNYAKKVRDGVVNDSSTLVRILEMSPDEDWTDPKVWHRCMPFEFIDFEEIAKKCEIAKVIPYQRQTFQQLHLGVWGNGVVEDTWISPELWEGCRDEFTEQDIADSQEPCHISLDLSSCRDLTSMSLFAPQSGRVLSWSWLPGEGISDRQERDGVPYVLWEQQGYLQFTSGPRIVYKELGPKINEVLSKFNVTKFVADPRDANLVLEYLDQEPEAYYQYPRYMGPPTKWLESAIAERKIKHNGNPLFSWCMLNVIVKDNVPNKGLARKRIDPATALISAVGSWLGAEVAVDFNAYYADKSNAIVDREEPKEATT